ncbi:uncharacterized protein LOC143368051 [Andrena cerasifolii]|uniref:uncharacterized protein LOC143368051 n=1 Tax=Andrena cerasifolii TaxID=2819439 RepID=UPI004038404A
MTLELFYEYIANKFYPWVAACRIQLPVILFLDGHVSHMTQPLSAFCHDHHIILVALPPNTTHLMQPMDVTMFSPLKAHWRKEVNAYRIENHVLSVAKHDFAVLLANVFTKMDLKTILSNGFSACGLHPFVIDKLDLSKVFIRSKNNDSETTTNQEPSLIESFEKYIDPDTLKQFRACGEVEKWEGQTDDTNLYRVWKSMRSDCYKTNIEVCSHIHNDNSIEPLSVQVLHDEPTLQHMDCVTDVEQQKGNLPMEVLNPELIVLQNVADVQEVSSNINLQFSVLNDEGNVYFALPIDLSEEILLNVNVNTSSNVQHEHKTPEDHVNNENKVYHNSLLENIENSSNVINVQESTNIAETSASTSNANTVSQPQQFLYWPTEKTSKKKRISKVKIPSVMLSEEGLQWYKEQENKKREVEEAKELKKTIPTQNASIMKEKLEEAKKLKASKNAKKKTIKTKKLP